MFEAIQTNFYEIGAVVTLDNCLMSTVENVIFVKKWHVFKAVMLLFSRIFHATALVLDELGTS